MSKNHIFRSSSNSKKQSSPSCLSPVSKLLGNRTAAVQSLVSKVEAISFEATPHHQKYPTVSSVDSAPSPQGSPPIGLSTSPNLNEISGPHLDEFVRETPTIRHLKTSLRSRLQSDSDRHQKRVSEDSSRSDSTNHHHQTPNASPCGLKPTSLKAQSYHSPSPIDSTPSSSSNHRITFSSPDLYQQPPKALTSSDRSSSNQSQTVNSLTSKPLSQSSPHIKYTSTISQKGCDVSFGINLASEEPHTQQSARFSASQLEPTIANRSEPRETSISLPDLRIPLINFSLSPPTLAQWSVEAYQSKEETKLTEIIAHLMMLPLHTFLAVAKKLPVAGKHLDLNPLFHQAEKDHQGILLTASQIAVGLTMAGGWKLARRILKWSYLFTSPRLWILFPSPPRTNEQQFIETYSIPIPLILSPVCPIQTRPWQCILNDLLTILDAFVPVFIHVVIYPLKGYSQFFISRSCKMVSCTSAHWLLFILGSFWSPFIPTRLN